jgi:A/G-specific adenine glycosylase
MERISKLMFSKMVGSTSRAKLGRFGETISRLRPLEFSWERRKGDRVRDLPQEGGLDPQQIAELRSALLAWYELNRRDLPWRRTRDPYAIWVSEVMLQQTRVAAVIDRYEAFLHNFPTVSALAHAAEAEVLALWSGLGYYRRARMLLKAAKVVSLERHGVMPENAAALRTLPGIGAYTSAAIASIAYGEPVAVVDGNVERVVQRLAGWGSPAGSSQAGSGQANLDRQTERLAQRLLDPAHAGDFNQAMMELGATVCLPRNPACVTCPLQLHCQTRGEHPTPRRAPMRSQDVAYALVIRTHRGHREVLLDQRGEEQTVMPSLWELPALLDPQVSDEHLRMAVRHAIMQTNYYVRIRIVPESEVAALAVPSELRRWMRLSDLPAMPLTGLARKVLLRAKLPELEPRPPLSVSSVAD